jgi:hypothetical protein
VLVDVVANGSKAWDDPLDFGQKFGGKRQTGFLRGRQPTNIAERRCTQVSSDPSPPGTPITPGPITCGLSIPRGSLHE